MFPLSQRIWLVSPHSAQKNLLGHLAINFRYDRRSIYGLTFGEQRWPDSHNNHKEGLRWFKIYLLALCGLPVPSLHFDVRSHCLRDWQVQQFQPYSQTVVPISLDGAQSAIHEAHVKARADLHEISKLFAVERASSADSCLWIAW